jgi:hypothetical protein
MDRKALEEGINTVLPITTSLLNKKPRRGDHHLPKDSMIELVRLVEKPAGFG